MDMGAFFGDGFVWGVGGWTTFLTTFMTGLETTGFWAEGAVSMDSLNDGDGDRLLGRAPPTRTRTGSRPEPPREGKLASSSSRRWPPRCIRRGDGDRRC